MNDFEEEPDWNDEPEPEMEPPSPVSAVGTKRHALDDASNQSSLKRLIENEKNGSALGDFLSKPVPNVSFPVPKIVQEDVTTTTPTHNITCNCNSLALEKIVKKEGPNFGKSFYCCGKDMNDSTKCNFFKWKDSVVTVTTKQNMPLETIVSEFSNVQKSVAASVFGGRIVNCKCLNEAVQRTVSKEGPNKGKLFWTCASKGCEFFEWCDKVGGGLNKPSFSSNGNAGAGGGSAKGSGSCFKCGGTGHWANNCPSKR